MQGLSTESRAATGTSLLAVVPRTHEHNNILSAERWMLNAGAKPAQRGRQRLRSPERALHKPAYALKV